ncbi:M23 family metallopeptidase [Halalkalibacter sp. APA_J-10(15)]|uniref:M23 family metallopeptidase n=1 Tax=Halalkalibacter sp. APA_J-10(15) TaxID=2933805 RepID=UPI001FF0FC80|nr:M23 family metallopeptidase [Halalkalibacter sp. APA_J-10(15)]MCK0470212.1 M23 family metallopeptidase [Halalkalibacter sp. APA_J-10(15)]
MNWKKRLNSRRWSFIIFSNSSKPVIHLNIPSFLLTGLPLVIFIPLAFFFFSQHTNEQLTQENEMLSDELAYHTEKVESLRLNLAFLEDETTEYETKMQNLANLENEMREYMSEIIDTVEQANERADSSDSSGGIDIPVSNSLTENEEIDLDNLTLQGLIESYQTTIADIHEMSEALKRVPTAWPADVQTITSHYGLREDPFRRTSAFHSGIDLGGPTGTPIYAGADGSVTLAQYYGGYGNTIIIEHSSTYETLYAHLSEMKVETGQEVKKGEIIGSLGSTGRSTGPHLHYEIWKYGEPVDPYPYMTLFFDYE